ncbi:unnamed protein product [Auanema sp. JU1783]|nr:unnamed protein product [Auanema sp. JU1783]
MSNRGTRGPRLAHRHQVAMNYMIRNPPFDRYNVGDKFERINAYDEAPLTQSVLNRSQHLLPTPKSREAVTTLLTRVRQILEEIAKDSTKNEEFKVEDVKEVGSWRKDIAISDNLTGDIAIILGILPTTDAAYKLGSAVVDELQALNEVATFATKDYGIHVAGEFAEVKVLITTIPANVASLQPDIHLSERAMMYNYHSIRHVAWFDSVADSCPLRVLVRVIKYVRSIFSGLQPLSVWSVEFLCYFCLMNTPNRSPLPIGPAFRRFFETLASGLFLPGSPGLVDPTEPAFRIASDMTLEDMDNVAATAQSIIRIINFDGSDIVLGLKFVTGLHDVAKNGCDVNGTRIKALENAYSEGCFKPYFCDEDESQ